MTRYIMIIIQFLYNKFSYEIKRRLLPFYILHIISVVLMAVLSEQYRQEIKDGKEANKAQNVLPAPFVDPEPSPVVATKKESASISNTEIEDETPLKIRRRFSPQDLIESSNEKTSVRRKRGISGKSQAVCETCSRREKISRRGR